MKRNLLTPLLFVLFLSLLANKIFGQVNYTFTSVAGTYTANSAPTTIHAAGVDDALSPAIDIGFTFKYECTDYTQIKVSSNGWLTLNTAVTSSNASNNLATGSDRPIIAPLWDDLQVYTGGTVNYLLSGTSPSRILTVEWKKMEWNYLASGDVISFQVKLYESTHATTPNRIEFIYSQGATAVNSGSASIGLSGTSSGDFYSLDGTGATPTASKVTETTGLSAKPSNGQIYRWDPVACCTPPTNQATTFTSSSVTTTTMTVGWTRGNGNNVMVIASAGSAPTDPSNGTIYTANAAYGSGTSVGGGFCVYNGSGTSVNITGLTASTSYYYAIYEYNTTGTCYNLTQLTGTVSTCASSAALPQSCDFTSYTGANLTTLFPNFSEAYGTSPAGTTSAWSYETDLVTTTAYVNMFGNSADEWIIGPTFSATGTSTVNFKAALTDYNSSSAPIDGGMTGTDDKVIVRVKTCEGSWIDVYTFESATIGSLSNTLTDFSVDLSSYNGQNITLAFYASEGTTDDGRDYNFHLDDILIENACSYPSTQATSFTSSSIISTSMTIGWTRGNGNNIIVIAKEGSAPTDPASGTSYTANSVYGSGSAVGGGFCIYDGSGTSENVTGLSSNTTYYYAVYEYYTAGTCYNTAQLAGNATTCLSTVALPQSCDFTSYTGANLTTLFPNFSEAFGASPAGTTSSWSYETDLVTTTAYVNMFGNSADEWIIGPTFTATATSTVNFKAALTDYNSSSPPSDGGMTGTDDKVIVRVKPCGGSWTDVYTFESSTIGSLSNTLIDFTVELGSYSGQIISVGFYATEGTVDEGRDYNFHLDDIFIENSCSYPSSQATSFTSSSITSTSMTIGWTRGNGNNVMVIAKEGSAPTDPVSGTSYTANAIYGSGSAVGGGYCVYNGSGTSVNVTGLSQTTTYYFAVYEYNTSGTCYRLSELSGNATTSCSLSITFPFSESFDGVTFPPTCWRNLQVTGTGLWARSVSGSNPTCSPQSGAGMAYFNSFSYANGTKSNLISPPLPFASSNCYTISFWIYGVYLFYDDLDIYVNTSPTHSGGTLLGSITLDDYSGWTQVTYNIPVSFSGSTSYIIFQATSALDNNIFIVTVRDTTNKGEHSGIKQFPVKKIFY